MLLGKISGTPECSRLHSDMFMDVSAPVQVVVVNGNILRTASRGLS